MTPTLKPGDRLKVIPYDTKRKIHRGDVIVFLPPGGSQKIVHRVFSLNSQKIRTRGDNNNGIDRDILEPCDILGRVVSAQRGNRHICIYGGIKGRIWARLARLIRITSHLIFTALGPGYHWLARTGIFRRWPLSLMKFRIFSIDRNYGRELRLMAGGCVIGYLKPGQDEWFIRRPFRLFIDESTLPDIRKND